MKINEQTPIWIQAGMGFSEYGSLPWSEKRKLLYKYRRIPIHDACGKCGVVIRWKLIKEFKPGIHHLVEAYLRWVAEWERDRVQREKDRSYETYKLNM